MMREEGPKVGNAARAVPTMAFWLFVVAYYCTYPVRVLFRSDSVEVLRPAVAGVVAIVGMRALALRCRGAPLRRSDAAVLVLVAVVVCAYGANVLLFPESAVLADALYKHAAFAAVLVVFVCLRGRIVIAPASKWAVRVVFGLCALTLFAAVLNSVYLRIPDEAVVNAKYFVGPFVRAGAGYVDANFLALNVISLMTIALLAADGAPTARAACLLLCSIAVFLTFSRAAYGAVVVLLVLVAVRARRSDRRLVVIVLAACVVALGVALLDADRGFLLRRFSDQEGASSTADRLAQYRSFVAFVADRSEISRLFVGLGGEDVFAERFGVHLHNMLLGLVLDVGVAPTLCLVLACVTMFRTAESRYSRLYLIAAGLQLMTLPNTPDPLYVGLVLSLVRLGPVRCDTALPRGPQRRVLAHSRSACMSGGRAQWG